MGQREGKVIVRRPVKRLFRGVWIRDDQIMRSCLGRSREGCHGNPFQYSCLENPVDGGAWRAVVHGVTKSWPRRKWFSIHAYNACYKSSSRIRPDSNLILFKDFWTRRVFSRETFQRVSIWCAQVHVEVRGFGHKEASWVRRWVAMVPWALHLVSSSLQGLIFITLWSYSSLLFLKSFSRSFQSFPLPVTTFNFHL